MNAVFCLIESNRGGRLEHFFGHFQGVQSELLIDFFANGGIPVVKGRQAM
jgi:hypothetical protein